MQTKSPSNPVNRSFAIVSALLAGAGIFVLAQQTFPPTAAAPIATPRLIDPNALPPLVKVLDAALVAYNGSDSGAFLALFAHDARPPATEHTYKAIFEGIYREEFGKFVSGSVIPSETEPSPNYGQIVYAASFEKRAHVKVSADLIEESGALKIVQLRFEKMQLPTPRAPNAS